MAALETRHRVSHPDRRSVEYRTRFQQYLQGHAPHGLEEADDLIGETRGMSVGSQSGGGFWVPDSWSDQLVLAANDVSPVRRAAEMAGSIVPTTTGGNLVLATGDDSAVSGEIVVEGEATAQTDISTAGAIVLPTFLYSSKLLLVSWQLRADAGPNFEGWLSTVLGRRIGRAENLSYTVGDGPNQPQGIVPNSAATITAAQSGTVSSDELLQLADSADVSWRFSPDAKYMMHGSTLSAIRLLKDASLRPLAWAPDPSGSGPGTIHGRGVVVNNDMPALATGNRSVVYADFSRFLIRDVAGAAVLGIHETFARNGQTGYLSFVRSGSALLSVGAVPAAVCLVQA